MLHQITEGIPAQYALNKTGQVCITFTDPAYVRSDMIIYDRRDSSLHAVLHEAMHLIGHVDEKMFAGKSEVVLSAPHYFTGTVRLKTPLIISH